MGKKLSSDGFVGATVHVKCKIEGEPAEFFLELKHRGIVSSAREAVVQGYSLSPGEGFAEGSADGSA